MSQVLLRPEQIKGDHFHLDGKEAHHVIRVLRKKKGDEIFLFNGQGSRFRGILTEIDPAHSLAHGRLIEEPAWHKATRVRLFQGLPKGSKIDYVIEKATELGVDEIIPFLSEKSLIRLDAIQSSDKQNRWARLAQAAAKQCDRSTIPVVSPACALMDLGVDFKQGLSLVLSVHPESQSFRSLIGMKENPVINLIVGPESGFSESELDWLISQGTIPISLGNLTLRTETAGLAALAIVNYELGLL